MTDEPINPTEPTEPIKPPTEPLKSVRHEKFARLVVETNGNPHKCLEGAGYKYSASYYCQLKARPEIADRISDLIEEQSSGICQLGERLAILSAIVRDPLETKSIRLHALKELHHQSGDDITKIDMNNTSTVKYVEINMPKKDEDEPYDVNEDMATGSELESLEAFMANLDVPMAK